MLLGVEHGKLRAIEQTVPVVAVSVEVGEAGACPNVQRAVLNGVGHAHLRQYIARLQGNHLPVFRHQDDLEAVGARPGNIARLGEILQPLRAPAQDGVSLPVAVAVVHALKIVQAEKEQPDAAAALSCLPDEFGELFEKKGGVRQAGQPVVQDAVFGLGVLQDEGVQDAAPQKVSYAVHRQQRIIKLDADGAGHRQAEKAYGAVAALFPPLRPHGFAKRVERSRQEEDDLETKGYIAQEQRVVFMLLIEAKKDRYENVYRHAHELECAEEPSCMLKQHAEYILPAQIAERESRPQQHGDSHGNEVYFGVYEHGDVELALVQQTPEGVGRMVGDDGEKKQAVVALFLQQDPAIVEEDIGIDDQMDRYGKQPCKRVRHGRFSGCLQKQVKTQEMGAERDGAHNF